MKKKILGISVCILLMAAAVPLTESSKNIMMYPTPPRTSETSMAENWTEIQKLLASDGTSPDNFGWSVSLDGDTALVGAAPDDNGKGSAYVFTRSGTSWTQQVKLLASDGAANDLFGNSVSLDGDTALIGAPYDDDNGDKSGSVYVFTRTGGLWTQEVKLLATDDSTGATFGRSVSLYGNTAFIGADYYDYHGNGAAYVFTRTGTTWTQQAKLLASDGSAGDQFSFYGASLDGDTALIGAVYEDDKGVDSGSAYVFTRTGTTWTQQAKLLASDGVAGDWFGYFISLDGDTALIGALQDDDNGKDSGSAYVFTRNGTTWTQQAKLLASDGARMDIFGNDVSLDGDTALIGAVQDDDNGFQSGSAYVFTRSGTTWTQQQKLLASDGARGDLFGCDVSLDGDTVLIGAPADGDNGLNSGSVYVFMKGGIEIDITGGLGVNAVITNHGITNVTNVTWQLHVKGGILGRINKTVNGTIDIPAGGSKTVGTGILFGLGALSITATVAVEEKTAKGTQIIIFSKVK